MMWVCAECRSPRVYRDSFINLNDPEDILVIDEYLYCDVCRENVTVRQVSGGYSDDA